mgnify:FL=1|jgi:hypothetical protein
MKKVTYDKSGIMKEAWNMFTRNYQICDFEYADFSEREYFEYASFADCLKEAWAHEKEVVERVNQKYADAEISEEVKAWDWACKKMGVAFEIDAYTKMTNVENMGKEAWSGTSVWSLAMRAVKMHMEIAA